jgi:hypothetical protein
MLSPVSHAPLQMFEQPTVVVMSGWGGSGKTQTIGRALQGLSRNIDQVGVIINERSEGSVNIDIARLPKGFEKLGLHGCACCSQLADVIAGVKTFASRGRKLTLIEQSPLSITSDLRHGLRQKGHEPIVVFAFNPAQFQNAPAIQVQGIRDADIILVTHQRLGSEGAQKAQRIIDAARGDLSSVPVIVDNGPTHPFPADMWRAMIDIRQLPKGGFLSSIGGLLGSRPHMTTDFRNERSAIVANYSEITVRPYATSAHAILDGVLALANKGVEISRVKGSLSNGLGVDVIQEREGFTLTQSPNIEGAGYLSLRSFKAQLSRHLGDIAAHLGTVDSNPDFVRHVVVGYPNEEGLKAAVLSGAVPLGFESDRYLNELRSILPFIRHISDPARKQELGNAFATAIQATVQARLSLVKVLNEVSMDPALSTIGLFNACYVLTNILCDQNLQMFSKHPLLVPLYEEMKRLNPAHTVLNTVVTLSKVRFEGRANLSRDEVRLLSQTLGRAREQGYISPASVESTISQLERTNEPDLKAFRSALRS